jgi:DAACS family dicarboxylate/amino acid:cation (Na+ or H+) symporter
VPWIIWTAEHVAQPIGQVFLRLLFMLVIPLVFSALVVGVCGLDLVHVGRLGVTLLSYAAGLSLVAVVIGMTLVNVIRPGEGLSVPVRDLTTASAAPAATEASAVDLVVGMIPDNPIKAAANGDMIGVILFALIFGIGLSLTRTDAAQRLRSGIEGVYDVMRTLIDAVLKLAPLGVGALLFATAARLGIGLLGQLLAYVGVVLLALALHLIVVYSLIVKVFGGRSPIEFFRDVRLAMTTAFATRHRAPRCPRPSKSLRTTFGCRAT